MKYNSNIIDLVYIEKFNINKLELIINLIFF